MFNSSSKSANKITQLIELQYLTVEAAFIYTRWYHRGLLGGYKSSGQGRVHEAGQGTNGRHGATQGGGPSNRGAEDSGHSSHDLLRHRCGGSRS